MSFMNSEDKKRCVGLKAAWMLYTGSGSLDGSSKKT